MSHDLTFMMGGPAGPARGGARDAAADALDRAGLPACTMVHCTACRRTYATVVPAEIVLRVPRCGWCSGRLLVSLPGGLE